MEMAIDTSQMIINANLPREEAIEKMKGELKDLCKALNQSIVIQSEDIYTKGKKLIVFDVESTLIQKSSLKNFCEKLEGNVKTIHGGTDFRDSRDDKMQAFIENVRVLKGMPISDFEKCHWCGVKLREK